MRKKNCRAKAWQICAILICLLAFLCTTSSCNTSYNHPTNQGISNVFTINNEFYYIKTDGTLYRYTREGFTPVYSFPTHIIKWSYIIDGLVFFDPIENTIKAYNPATETISFKLEVETDLDIRKSIYVSLVSDNNIYLKNGQFTYKIGIDDHVLNRISIPVSNQLYSDDKYSVFQSDDYKRVFIMELATDDIRHIATEESALPVITACIAGNTLYYARSDGLVRKVSISNQNPQEVEINDICYDVLALASSKIGIISVVGERTGDLTETAIVVINNENNITKLEEGGEPEYSVPGSCHIVANDSEYCFAVTTADAIRYGQF